MARSRGPALYAASKGMPIRRGRRAPVRPSQRRQAWRLIDRCGGVPILVVVALAVGLPLASEHLPSHLQAALPEWWSDPSAELSGPVIISGGVRSAPPGVRPLSRDDLSGAVTHVRDGDTIEVEGTPVRLANLDCAERGTVAGDRASRRMRELAGGEQVTCTVEGRMSYDREVGTCQLAATGQDLGRVLIGEGTCGRWQQG